MNIEQLEKSLLGKADCKTHHLEGFLIDVEQVADQIKTFWLCPADRPFAIGDYIQLRPIGRGVTATPVIRRISTIEEVELNAAKSDYVILSFFTKYDYTEMLHRKTD